LDAQLLLAREFVAQKRNGDVATLVKVAMPALEQVIIADIEGGGGFSGGIFDLMTSAPKYDGVSILSVVNSEQFAILSSMAAATKEGLFQTEVDSVAIDMQHILALKFTNEGLFRRALERAQAGSRVTGNGCDDSKFLAACVAGIAGDALTDTGKFDLALEYQASRIEFLRADIAPPIELTKSLLDYADLELRRGLPASAALRLKELPDQLEIADLELRARRFRVEAAVSYLALEDNAGDAAAQQLQSLMKPIRDEARVKNRVLPNLDFSAYAPPSQVDAKFTVASLRDGLATEITAAAAAESEGRMFYTSALYDAFVDLMEHFRRGAVSQGEVDAVARKILAMGGEYDKTALIMQVDAGRNFTPSAALEVRALLHRVASGQEEEEPVFRFMLERDIRKKRAIASAYFKQVVANSYTLTPDFCRNMTRFSKDAWRAGYPMSAQVALETMFEVGKGDIDAPLQLEMADTFLDAYSRLAQYQLRRGEVAKAHASLANAEALAKAKIKQGWQIGSDQLMQSFRQLAPFLRRIAQVRADFLLTANNDGSPANAAAAFESMQTADLSELSLASHGATKRRVATLVGDADAIPRRDLLQEDLRHYQELARVYDRNSQVQHRVAAIEAELATLIAKIEGALPNAGLFAEITPVNQAEVQAALAERESFVLLHSGDTALYGVLIEKHGKPTSWRTDITKQALEAEIKTLRAGATISNGKYPDFPIEVAQRLYQAIFGKIAGKLKAAKRIVIVAAGPLQALPFSMLAVDVPALTEPVIKAKPEKITWLIRQNAIAQMPSARAFVAARTQAPVQEADMQFLGIGNPVLGPPVARLKAAETKGALSYSDLLPSRGLAEADTLRKLPSLPETEIELTKIANELGSDRATKLLLALNATEAMLKSEDLGRYRIIAFATHGVIASQATAVGEPGLVLTPPDTASAHDDGYLAASEIIGLKLNAELVILSACETAAPDGRPRAEGLSGLAKAFFAAGARGVLVTHLPIPSLPSVEITTRMISARTADASIDWAQALQRAVLDLLDMEGARYVHPADWGAFAMIGATATQ
jgi:CHAT domain-containing protein